MLAVVWVLFVVVKATSGEFRSSDTVGPDYDSRSLNGAFLAYIILWFIYRVLNVLAFHFWPASRIEVDQNDNIIQQAGHAQTVVNIVHLIDSIIFIVLVSYIVHTLTHSGAYQKFTLNDGNPYSINVQFSPPPPA
jgi:heme/copper-type cytochrome/quinol oxidase subunit 2